MSLMPYCVKPRGLTLAALLAALGIALSLVESFLPVFLPVPGAKLGLANIVLLLCLYLLPVRLTAAVFFIRLLLTALLTGTIFSSTFFIALAGGSAGLATMLLVRNLPGVSLYGVSLAGAAAHNSGQLLAACWFISNPALLYYLPLLLICSLPAGYLTAAAADRALRLLAGGALNEDVSDKKGF